jgi:competence CoiA-like predicted nuclease
MKTAMINGRQVDADEGVDIKNNQSQEIIDFRCPECGHPVRVHRSGGNIPAHFEHHERNETCTLVHRR